MKRKKPRNKNSFSEPIEHTADIGMRVWGKDLKDLFENSAQVMFGLLIEHKGNAICRAEEKEINIAAVDKESLLHDWLAELLSLYEAKRVVFERFDIKKINEKALKATLYAVPLTCKNHTIKTEIKAVTYHKLFIGGNKGRLKAEVIFDV